MEKRVIAYGLCVAVAVAAGGVGWTQTSSPSSTSLSGPEDYLQRYCIECHNQEASSAMALFSGLFLDRVDVRDPGRDWPVWEEVLLKLNTGMMPPSSEPRPDADHTRQFISYLETELERVAAETGNPGRPALHRLNRTEYANVIRDLFGLEVDARALLPADNASYGFDNIAGSLGVSPVLIERYAAAAAKVSRLAVGSPSIETERQTYYVPPFLSQVEHFEGFPFGSRGGMRVEHYFPLDAEYLIRLDLIDSGENTVLGATLPNEQLELSIDGERVALFDISRPPPPAPTDDDEDEDIYDEERAAEEAERVRRERERRWEVRLPLSAGAHEIMATFIRRNHAPVEDLVQQAGNVLLDPPLSGRPDVTLYPHMSSITVDGPFDATGPGDTPSRQRVFVCQPESERQESVCAREILSTLAHRAYRRPPDTEHLSVLMDFFEQGRAQGGFETGIEVALQRILSSPQFVFRFEREPEDAGQAYPLADHELASRLAFFLWSSLPDHELLDLAARGRLSRPAVLRQQVQRMLADPRSAALTENFAGQWLYLRNLSIKDASVFLFPDFDDVLRETFRRETELLFDRIAREDRSVLELLTADYTFVNERLAKHYGMNGVYGSRFRQVPVTDDRRRGLLGHASILFVTSQPNRTSPVTRGVWVLENILGAHVPTPPLEVPPLEEVDGDIEQMTVREMMAVHNARPFCAGCHAIMDPVGLALENYDVIGRWRTADGSGPIDASGKLVDGTVVDGPAELREALLNYSDQFVRNMTAKLMTYALGRGVEYYDMPAVRSIVREAAADDYRFSSLVMGIVMSEAFRMRAPESLTAATAATD